ncbi:hypothetical protein BASA50_001386 [Batrachochytrium salamandrivorans]|uniref:Centromere protein J C-terminal domain-containing protein n=1 Tax=Batrachochytrium salamandrivorans TaxID=1357716 RepID=A0ABQ8EVZ1_9FUNG|nr:hypothetical protein BASA50_001386 [Batrachochytrium salamandrivorans]
MITLKMGATTTDAAPVMASNMGPLALTQPRRLGRHLSLQDYTNGKINPLQLSSLPDHMSDLSWIQTGFHHRDVWLRCAADETASLLEFLQLEELLVDNNSSSNNNNTIGTTTATAKGSLGISYSDTHQPHSSEIDTRQLSVLPSKKMPGCISPEMHNPPCQPFTRSPMSLQRLLDDSLVLIDSQSPVDDIDDTVSTLGLDDQSVASEYDTKFVPTASREPMAAETSCNEIDYDLNNDVGSESRSDLPQLSDHAVERMGLESSLLQKLFPAMRMAQKKSTADSLENIAGAKFHSTQEIQQLKETIKLLESTLLKSQQSNKSLKQENKELQEKLTKKDLSKSEFESYRMEQLLIINKKHDENMRAFKKERLLWERHKKASEILPNKKERQEIDLLKTQLLEKLKLWKDKETRLLQTQDRLGRRVDELTRRNLELLDEVKTFEQERANFIANHPERRSGSPFIEQAEIQVKANSRKAKSNSANVISHRPSLPKLSANGTASLSTKPKSASANGIDRRGMTSSNVMAKPVASLVDPAESALDGLEKTLGLGACNEERLFPEGKRDRFYDGGTRLVWHVNGTMKQTRADGLEVVYFCNGDYKTLHPDGHVVYWYNGPRTLHTTQPAGLEILQFDSGQIEKRYTDGTQEIIFPDQTVKYIFASRAEEVIFPDGKVQLTDPHGARTIHYPDGTKELHQNGIRAKYCANGMVKTVHAGDSVNAQ